MQKHAKLEQKGSNGQKPFYPSQIHATAEQPLAATMRKVQQQRAPVDWILKPADWIMKHVDKILELHGNMSTGSYPNMSTG